MTKAPRKVAPKAARQDDGRIAPVTALNSITYGKDQKAKAHTVFRPASQAERDELVDVLGAAREPTESELAVFEKTEDASAPPAAAVQAPTSESTPTADGAGGEGEGDKKPEGSGEGDPQPDATADAQFG